MPATGSDGGAIHKERDPVPYEGIYNTRNLTCVSSIAHDI